MPILQKTTTREPLSEGVHHVLIVEMIYVGANKESQYPANKQGCFVFLSPETNEKEGDYHGRYKDARLWFGWHSSTHPKAALCKVMSKLRGKQYTDQEYMDPEKLVGRICQITVDIEDSGKEKIYPMNVKPIKVDGKIISLASSLLALADDSAEMLLSNVALTPLVGMLRTIGSFETQQSYDVWDFENEDRMVGEGRFLPTMHYTTSQERQRAKDARESSGGGRQELQTPIPEAPDDGEVAF